MKLPHLFQNKPLMKKPSEYNALAAGLQKVQGGFCKKAESSLCLFVIPIRYSCALLFLRK